MSTLKTRPTDANVLEFIHAVEPEARRNDCLALIRLMEHVTQSPPRMWGPSIVGFGTYQYKYASGRTGEWFLTGFSPRKRNLTLYLMSGIEGLQPILTKLGKHSCGKGCLYLKRLSDHDPAVIRQLIETSVSKLRKRHSS